jgi:hypothetical protein
VADASFGPDPDAATRDAPADAKDEKPILAVACAGFCVADAGFGGAG